MTPPHAPSAALTALTALAIGASLASPATAGTTVQIGTSGKTFASSTVQCVADPAGSRLLKPAVDAGLFNPKNGTTATVALDGTVVANVSSAVPATQVWLTSGTHTVVVALGKKLADRYTYSVADGQCPDTSGNWFSADGTLEYAASGKSYATVTPGCALNGATGQAQPYVHLFDNGGFLLNVSVNGQPLTQLSSLKTHVPVFLGAGLNVISAANGSLSTDYYVRDGGDGRCVLP